MQKFKCKVCGYVVEGFESLPEDWKCPICGAPKSEFESVHQKGEPQTGGEAQEKHVPIIENKDGKVFVKIGAAPHPMLPEHHIVWVELRDGNKQLGKKDISSNSEPAVLFDNIEYKDNLKAYALCNLHGVWES